MRSDVIVRRLAMRVEVLEQGALAREDGGAKTGSHHAKLGWLLTQRKEEIFERVAEVVVASSASVDRQDASCEAVAAEEGRFVVLSIRGQSQRASLIVVVTLGAPVSATSISMTALRKRATTLRLLNTLRKISMRSSNWAADAT